MVSPPVNSDNRACRLRRLAAEYGVEEPPALAPLPKPSRPPSPPSPTFKNPDDEFHAEEQLKRRRLANAQEQKSSNGSSGGGGSILKRRSNLFTRKDAFSAREIFDELDAHVANQGSVGVCEALLHKLHLAGGDMNGITTRTNTRISFSLRRRGTDDHADTPSRILQTAVSNGQADMVAVLLPHASPASIDAALPIALDTGNVQVTEQLLIHGANLSSLPEGRFQFQQLCINGEYAELVGLLLRSDGRPPPDWISGAMIAASRKGDLATVVRLSRSIADGGYSNAEALKAAVATCRVDIALAILTGTRPPAKTLINEAFASVFEHPNMMPAEKKALAEVLLLAGAEGDVVSKALVKASEKEFYEMIDVLLAYGASIEYDSGMAIRQAIRQSNLNLVLVLLGDGASLSPSLAAAFIADIPKRIKADDRRTLLTLLLRKGAEGPQLDDALIDAVETQDLDCVRLLVTPHFSGTGKLQTDEQHNIKRGPRNIVFESHATAGVNHKGGLALSLAVAASNIAMVELMLDARPSLETLVQVFPTINKLAKNARYDLTRAFLGAGVSGAACVHAALQYAIDDQPPRRDMRLIKLLVQEDVDINARDGILILLAIKHLDSDLLQLLLRKAELNPRNVTMALRQAMAVQAPARTRIMILLLQGVAAVPPEVAGECLVAILQEQHPDVDILTALLHIAEADVNINMGQPLVLAVRCQDFRVLTQILQHGKPNAETLDLAVQAMDDLPSTEQKAIKLKSIIQRTKHKESLNRLLVTEVEAVLACTPETRTLAVLRTLLDARVDVNAHKAAALCTAVHRADVILTDLLFAFKPNTISLQLALPHALTIQDEMDRLTFTARLLDAGVPAVEANRALTHAITKYPTHYALINRLAAKADMSDGEALQAAVHRASPDLVELLLRATNKRHKANRINEAFAATLRLDHHRHGDAQRAICGLLLKAGASGPLVSDALLVAASTGDIILGTLLLNHGVPLDYREGQAVIEACRAGSLEILKVFLSAKYAVSPRTLDRGLQAATEVGNLQHRAHVYRMLLDQGVLSEEVINEQLVSAARFGDEADEIVRLLLRAGASVDFKDGEAVYNATRCAFLGILGLMLGVADCASLSSSPSSPSATGRVNGNVDANGKGYISSTRPRMPSSKTLARALRASAKLSDTPRCQVIEWLFEAGLQVSDDVHIALNKAVNEPEPSISVITLLLAKGALPTALGCKTFIDAVQREDLELVTLFLQQCDEKISAEDIAWTIQGAFDPARTHLWLTQPSLAVAKCLVTKGVHGKGLSRVINAALQHLGTTEYNNVAQEFASLLIPYSGDINEDKGAALVKATKTANRSLVEQILRQGPNSEALSLAFPHVFDHDGFSEREALEFIEIFTQHHHDGDTDSQLDPLLPHPHDAEPVLLKALARFPRSAKIVQKLLDAGYYHDPMTTARMVVSESECDKDDNNKEEEEQVNLLTWCLLQPQKRVSSNIITTLVNHGARVSYTTPISKTTPLMLAVQTKRPDIVKQLILSHAEVDVTDCTGNTPLTMATRIGGELGTTMMANILAAEPSQNDGSLHNTARALNLQALQVLVEFGHEVDFPSSLHGGRTALGELCLHAAADHEELPVARAKAMEKTMAFLVKQGTDLSLLFDGKSVLLLAMESADPVATTSALLKIGMWKHINKPWNLYNDGTFTYSPTEYVKRVMSRQKRHYNHGSHNNDQDSIIEQLYTLLKANRAQDVYYANEGPQPDEAVGLPEELVRVERERKARVERIRLQAEDHARNVERTKEVADIQNQIFLQRAQLEDERAERRQASELDGIRAKALLEEELFAERFRQARAERAAALEHQSSLTQAEVERKRLLAETELDAEQKRQRLALQSAEQLSGTRLNEQRQMNALRQAEREDVGVFEMQRENRIMERILAERKLLDRKTQMMASLAELEMPQRRQIGFISGELD